MKNLKPINILLGLAPIIMPQSSASADVSLPVNPTAATSRPAISKFGILGSTKWTTKSVSDAPQAPVFMLDNTQPIFSVDPVSYMVGTARIPTILNAYVGPAANGYTILMNGDSSSDLKLSDLFVQTTNTSQQGTTGSYYSNSNTDFQNVPSSPTVLWQTPEQTNSGPAFSLSFEVRNLRKYPAGNYSARLFFTIIPQ